MEGMLTHDRAQFQKEVEGLCITVSDDICQALQRRLDY